MTDMSSKDWHAEGARLILELKRIDRYFAAEYPSTTDCTVAEAIEVIAGLMADNDRLKEQAVHFERNAFMADEDRKDERARAEAAEDRLPEMQPAPFTPFWPPALRAGESYRVLCDDKGRNGGTWLDVFLANDGDVHVSMQDWENVPEGEPDPFPSLRVRTYTGGGRNERTRQALLWLAEAIRLDTAPRPSTEKKS